MKWVNKTDTEFYLNGLAGMKDYFFHLNNRRQKYPYDFTSKYSKEIFKNGFCRIPNVFSGKVIENLNIEFQQCVLSGNVKHDGEHFTMLQNPLLNSKTSFEIATSDTLFNIASEFFKCTPSLCTQNFRLSKLNSQAPQSTQIYHCDQNSLSFVKFFIYLNDVCMSGGPLTYVAGSHRKKPANHLNKYRWSDEEIQNLYGKESIKYLTASAGDLLVANTTGYHRGTKPTKKDRKMLTLNYVVHVERGANKLFSAKKEWVDELPEHKKPLFDFMELV